MNSDQLRYFELAYHEGNFSAAARLVPISHQGFSKAIKSLEKELDVPLFSYDPLTGLPTPTDFAHELHEYAAVTESNRRLLRDAFDRIKGETRRTIKLGCSLGVMGLLTDEFTEAYEASHPGITLQYWEVNDTACEASLRDGSFDLALVVTPFNDDVDARLLYECPVYAWVHRDNPLSGKASLDITDFASQDFAIPGKGFKCYDLFSQQAEARSVQMGRIFQMSEIFQIYEFALANRGLGFTARHHIGRPCFSLTDDVVAVPVEGMTWGFGIERLKTYALRDHEQSFWNYCCDTSRLKLMP